MLTQLKDFWSYKRNLYELSIFWKEMHIRLISLKIKTSWSFKVSLENCILICRYFNQSLPKSFKIWFTLATASHRHNTRCSNSGCLKIPSHKRKIYGRHSVNITSGAIYPWNYLQKTHVNILFYQLTLTKLKSLIKKLYTSNYN